ncbi:MAG: M61 family peptidase, partial [Acidobacteriaceae bacterium]
GSTPPQIVPYEFDELVTDLNQVVPYDWAKFLRERVYTIQPHANLEGIEQGGYKLVYTDKPNTYDEARQTLGRAPAGVNVWYSLGLSLDPQGGIVDVRVGSPADKARLAPGEKILAVNGKVFSSDALRAAVHDSKTASGPLALILQNDTHVATVAVDYHAGERYPALVRVDGTPDYLDEIAKPLTPAPPPAAQ